MMPPPDPQTLMSEFDRLMRRKPLTTVQPVMQAGPRGPFDDESPWVMFDRDERELGETLAYRLWLEIIGADQQVDFIDGSHEWRTMQAHIRKAIGPQGKSPLTVYATVRRTILGQAGIAQYDSPTFVLRSIDGPHAGSNPRDLVADAFIRMFYRWIPNTVMTDLPGEVRLGEFVSFVGRLSDASSKAQVDRTYAAYKEFRGKLEPWVARTMEHGAALVMVGVINDLNRSTPLKRLWALVEEHHPKDPAAVRAAKLKNQKKHPEVVADRVRRFRSKRLRIGAK